MGELVYGKDKTKEILENCGRLANVGVRARASVHGTRCL